MKKGALSTLTIAYLFAISVNANSLSVCETATCIEYFKQYQAAATRGHAGAMSLLGQLYQAGYGTEKNTKKALHYYKKAAKGGDIAAHYKAGLVYLSDPNLKDLDKGVRYLATAARKNYKNANFLLGIAYLSKDFGLHDLIKADSYLAKSYRDNHPDMPAVIELIQTSQPITAESLPDLSSALANQPLAKNEEGSLIWPKGETEVITITSPPIEEVLTEQLVLYRRPAKALGSRLPNSQCKNQFGCYSTSGAEGLLDFPFIRF
ncbi:sel1 repeat family protein [Thalassotalea euphylliae]|uniref:Sel1 repeat family protein n=1 Tax=Thalassotalea euphylliae TaxID=1655234 RepID=A0A3E0TNM4_9GAMM|nr:tetratricopeptide repeat protein [Thalassotalea euphylliae]REL25692.1 sel1 repeat family protein [Thalassotalea euphylliae]